MIILRKIFLGHASEEFMVSVNFKLNFNRVKFKLLTIFAKKKRSMADGPMGQK